jgi:uncharacterized linocin/CFP29 family protein
VDTYSQDCWTEAQWTQVREAVRDEAKKQRVAASFLPLHGPLPVDAQTVPLQELETVAPAGQADTLEIRDFTTRRLTTLSVHVALRSAQVAEPDLSSALVAFRRAASLIARTEDFLVFRGQLDTAQVAFALPPPCNVTGGEFFDGLLDTALGLFPQVPVSIDPFDPVGDDLVRAVTEAIGVLEQRGHTGPYALALGTLLYTAAHTPNLALVLPADRIKPMLDGPLVRSSTLFRDQVHPVTNLRQERSSGVLVSLASDLVDLVVASEIDVQLLQVTAAPSPRYVYRVSERLSLRIKQEDALVALV